jgi:hypothetical protein
MCPLLSIPSAFYSVSGCFHTILFCQIGLCVLRDIAILKKRPYVLRRHYHVETYCEEIRYPLIGHINEDEIAGGYFQQGGATAHTHSLCFRDATAQCA